MAVVDTALPQSIRALDRVPFLRSKRDELKDFLLSVTTPRMAGLTVDYSAPAGDPGELGPDSMSWKVFRHIPVVLAGAGTAVLLEMIDRHVGAGVSQFSTYREDPISRLRGTLSPAYAYAYAPTGYVDALASRIAARHKAIQGQAFDNSSYQAMDPGLFSWVHATAIFGFMQAYARFVEPGVSMADRDRYIAEASPFARALGCSQVPESWSDILDYFEDYRKSGQLSHTPYVEEFKTAAQTAKQAPLGSGGWLLQVSYTMLPDWAVEYVQPSYSKFGLTMGDLMVRVGSKTLTTLVPDDVPAAACARAGVPVAHIS